MFKAELADINKAIEIASEFTPAFVERERIQARADERREGVQ